MPNKIPKIIHYCWLSGEEKPAFIQKCISSWEKVMPDYEIWCWDTKRFDIHSVKFVEEAYMLYTIMEEYISTLMSLFSKNSTNFYTIRHLLLSSLIFMAKKKMTIGLNRPFLERKKEIYLSKNAWTITLTEISSLKMGLMTNP